jgi:hypothetical protein
VETAITILAHGGPFRLASVWGAVKAEGASDLDHALSRTLSLEGHPSTETEIEAGFRAGRGLSEKMCQPSKSSSLL